MQVPLLQFETSEDEPHGSLKRPRCETSRILSLQSILYQNPRPVAPDFRSPLFPETQLIHILFCASASISSQNDYDSNIWFTDPVCGSEYGACRTPVLPNQVYRFDHKDGRIRATAESPGRPIGMSFPADQMTLYVDDIAALFGKGIIDTTRPSIIYAGCDDGINLWNPGDTLLDKILLEGGIGNLGFGEAGKLFAVGDTVWWRVDLNKAVVGATAN